jgi:hypothetical protein
MFSPRSLRHCGGSGKGRGAEITPLIKLPRLPGGSHPPLPAPRLRSSGMINKP